MTDPTIRIDLAGIWNLQGGDLSLPMPIPGDVHSVLLHHGKIPDPYWSTNEEDVQWVSARDWSIDREVQLTPDDLACPSIELEAAAVDTVVEVIINGVQVAAWDSMHRLHHLEVRPHLVVGTNRLRLVFRSAEQEALRRAAALPYPIPGSWNCRKPHFNLLRKPQCHPGWDWGICLVPAGVYGPIGLRLTRLARIEAVTTTQAHTPGRCVVTVAVDLHATVAGTAELRLTFDSTTERRPVTLAGGRQRVEVALTVDAPRLWWPNGAGDQPLYPLEVSLEGHTVRKRLGLRTLEVIVDKDAVGTGMRIRCNGRDLFAKGANWIPSDALPARQTEAVWRGLLASARAAHMNMIRVWGGGQYEQDAFYDLCDDLGLMVWHDHMFACALYPSTPEFLATVTAEVTDQVTRLRDHACLAVWCGDNECVGALTWYDEPKRNRDRYLIDWDRLSQARTAAAQAADPTRLFWPSSPCAGPGDFSDTWHDDRHGDMHYWEVWHGGKGIEAYHAVTPRFCSEFGYQSFPSLETVRTFCPEEEWNVTSPVMEHHQRHPGGNRLIIEMFTRYFRLPCGFPQFLYLSQVLQAIAIRTAVEHWRRLRPVCMGTLYWQLNDNWPVASWSSLEYGGRWKQLHHHARRFYAPVAASAHLHEGRLDLWVVNDTAAPVTGSLAVEVWSFEGRLLATREVPVTVDADASALVGSLTLEELAPGNTVRKRFVVLVPRGLPGASTEAVPLAPWKACRLADPGLTATVAGDAVTLTCQAPAFFVQVSAPGLAGEFDDNSIILLPGRPRVLRHQAGDLPATVTVEHLRSSYS